MGFDGQSAAANLTFTKFIFVLTDPGDAAALQKLKSAGSNISRGFFNDYDADGSREGQPTETIQFLVSDKPSNGDSGIAAARFAVQVSANYRPRLDEVTVDLKRRLNGTAELIVLDGAERATRYSSVEMDGYARKPALARQSGRTARNAIVIPMSKTAEWWEKSILERHAYFYPHHAPGGTPAKGHAVAAQAGIATVFRRLYHNPDGYQRPAEFDFITYFECADEHVGVFETIRGALRDERQNPEWNYVVEGPEWRGRRVLRW